MKRYFTVNNFLELGGVFLFIFGTSLNLYRGNYGWAAYDVLIGSWAFYVGKTF